MSVQVKRRRESAAFLAGYVGAQGELLVDTTNNRVQVHDGATPGGWAAAKLSEVIIVTRTPVADANYTALPADRTIAFTALTAARTVTLPAASAYQVGLQLLVVDESGACSFTSPITIARAGSDTIDGAASALVTTPYGFLALVSNGTGKWTIVDFTGATTAQLTNRNTIINGNFAINQRAYASNASLVAGAYAHDRWKAGTGGCAYTFTQAVPDTGVTITTGTLVQAIEPANVSTTAWWLTWTGTATARVWQGTASGAYSAGLPMTIGGVAVNALLVTGLTPGTVANVEFATGGLGVVQIEAALPNAGPTRFERRPIGLELALCQRYFQRWQQPPTKGFCTSGTAISRLSFGLAVTMRAAPTLTMNGNLYLFDSTTVTTLSSISASYNTAQVVEFDGTAATALTSHGFVVGFQNGTSSLDLNAEI